MTRELRLGDRAGAKRKRRRRLVAGLHLERRVIDRAAVEARAGPGLEAADLKAERAEVIAEAHRGEVAGAARRVILQPDMDEALEEGAGGQDDGRRLEDLADLRLDAAHGAILDDQPLDAGLANRQVGRRLEHALHAGAVGGLVGLGAARADGRAPCAY